MPPISKLVFTVGVKAILARKHHDIILFIWVGVDGRCAEVEEKVTHCLVIKSERFSLTGIGGFFTVLVRYHTGGSMKLNAHILHLAHMVYL